MISLAELRRASARVGLGLAQAAPLDETSCVNSRPM